MHRRSFLSLLPVLALPRAPRRRRVAVTMDDVAWSVVPEAFGDEVLPRLLGVLEGSRAALFPVGRHVDNASGHAILIEWSRVGHWIGNHTYDHQTLDRAGPGPFIESIEEAEDLLSGYGTFRRWFRFPALKEGKTRESRDRVRSFLDAKGYVNAHVTIDTSDWYFDQRLREKLEDDPGFPVERYREPYVAHVLDRARYYDGLSVEVLGRSVPHTLLVHYNLLNAFFLEHVLEALENEGFQRIDADEAFADAVYRERVDTLPAGESLLWSVAHATGRYGDRLRYPGEDGAYEKARLDALGL